MHTMIQQVGMILKLSKLNNGIYHFEFSKMHNFCTKEKISLSSISCIENQEEKKK
jgi:hypothetical protein